MKRLILACVVVCALSCLGSLSVKAQNESVGVPGASAARSPAVAASVLRLVKFSGAVADAHGRPAAAGAVGITFALYAAQQGGAPLWLETQNLTLESQGRYTALLGATQNEGLPLEIFASGEARWLGITVQGQAEQPRVLLVAVPYALKAADAETLGGRPPSAFVLAAPPTVNGTETMTGETTTSTSATGGSAVTVSGTVGRIAKFTAADAVGDSVLFEDGTGKVGLGTTTPVEQLDIAGPSRTRINLGNQSTVQFASSGFSMRLTQAVDAHTQWDFFAEKNTAGSATGQTTFQIRRRNSAQTEAVTPILIDKDTNVILQAGFKAGTQTFGNVGIGTAAPTQKLQVLGNVRITGTGNGLIFPDGSSLLTATGGLRNTGSTVIGADTDTTGSGGITFQVGNVTQMVLTNGGNVGIGTASPAEKLDVAGNIKASGSLTVHGFRVTPDVAGINGQLSLNVIAGSPANNVAGGVLGATIAGGGETNAPSPNQVGGNYGTVGGGRLNTASGLEATVAGGSHNTANDNAAVVGGGSSNTAGFFATVSGGSANTATGQYSVTTGGKGNTVSASFGTIGGGGPTDETTLALANRVTDKFGTVGGGGNNQAGNGDGDTTNFVGGTVGGGFTNTASGVAATVGGGRENLASDTVATVGGGEDNTANAPHATVGGGSFNSASHFNATVAGGTGNSASGLNATIGGGSSNAVSAAFGVISGGGPADEATATLANRVTDKFGTVGGGGNNQAGNADGDATNATFATVAGGQSNTAKGPSTTVGGGSFNFAFGHGATVAGGESNAANSDDASVGGGSGNTASCIGGVISSPCTGAATSGGTVAGGIGNGATGLDAAIGGGFDNLATLDLATVGGGDHNNASGSWTTVGGGKLNTASATRATVGGGETNTASGNFSVVAGGTGNTASGADSAVPGGALNVAGGLLSFAAGNKAKAVHDGAFVWGDSMGFDISSTTANQFTARATGGVRFISAIDGSGNPTAGVTLAAGGGSWSSLSDRNAKENFILVDGSDLLAKLDQIPMSRWNYKTQPATIRHLGPMAQDFYAAFGLGPDDRHITTIDGQGVALAAVQALYRLRREDSRKLEEEEQTVRAQQARLAADEAEIGELKADLAKDEALLEQVRAALAAQSHVEVATARGSD